MSVTSLIHRLRELRMTDEDGQPCWVRWNDGLREEHLARYERSLGVVLPASFRAMWAFSDGCDLCGLMIQSAAEQVFLDGRLLTFHNWGNGDFDCLDFGRPGAEVPVVFMNHGPDVTAFVAASFEAWLAGVLDELLRTGTLAHPRDCMYRGGALLYAPVVQELAGRDCELNRE